jgi:4-hydroxybenzoate polyprenyltransferase
MGTREAHVLTVRRPKWRAYVLLARISNLPTVWSNVLAGMVVGADAAPQPLFLRLAASASLFYVGGMFLNDAFDADIDARERPERPVPAGDVSRREASTAGGALLAVGFALLPRTLAVLALGIALAAAIVLYDYRHKGDRLAPLVMGLCRGLVYCIAAAALASVTIPVALAALVITVYVIALTVVARRAGPAARWLVPVLIAGISLVDATIIVAMSSREALAVAAAAAFPLTLLLQRVVPGD